MTQRTAARWPLISLIAFSLAATSAGCAGRSSAMSDLDSFTSQAASSLAGLESASAEEREVWRDGARIVVEGHVSISVPDPEPTQNIVRDLVAELDGHIVRENLHFGHFMSTTLVRLPPDQVEELMERVGELGQIVDRSIKRTDVSWQIRDTDLQLENLRRTLVRYEELLHVADSVQQIISIESELNRVRTEIDRVQSKRAFLADQVTLATIEIKMMRDFQTEPQIEPRAWPGLRAGHLTVARRDAGTSQFAGLGFALQGDRAFHLDADLFTNLDEMATIDAGIVTIGGEMYSALLGDGRRRFLNPHLGWALGYAWVEGSNNFFGSLTFGLEMYRSERVLVDSSLRWGMLAGSEGPALVLQPLLSFHLAF